MKVHEPMTFPLLPPPTATPLMSTASIKRLLQNMTKDPVPIPPPTHPNTLPLAQASVPEIFLPIPLAPIIPPPVPISTPMDELDDFPFEIARQDDAPSPVPLSRTNPQTMALRLTKAMNPKFFEKSAMGTAWQAQKEQPFGKDNL
jgi:hypothetical protein